jgi:Ca2+-binding RTX toxin-like protein
VRRPRPVSTLLVSVAVIGASALAMSAGPAAAATSSLQVVSPIALPLPSSALTFSGAGDVTAVGRFVDVQIPPAPAPNTSTSGCEAADFAGFPAGAIAIVQRGTCTFAVKAANAQAGGAVAVVIFNEGQPGRTDVVSGTVGGPGITIPVVGTSFASAEQIFTIGVPVTLRVTVIPSVCDAPPATGTAVAGKNVVVAQPGTVTLGTDGPDVIYGTAGPDRIAGLGGDDLVFGLGGADQIAGGDGADILCGGADNDDLSGGAGADELSGDLGSNRLAGGDGTDVCSAFTAAVGCENETGATGT